MIDWFNQLWLDERVMLHPELAWLPLAVLAGGILLWIAWRQLRVRRGLIQTADGNALSRLIIPGSRYMMVVTAAFMVVGSFMLAAAVTNPAEPDLVPKDDIVVMQALDESGSMNELDAAPEEMAPLARIDAETAGAAQFALNLPEKAMSGLVVYSDESAVEVVVPPRQDRQPILEELENLEAEGGTAIGNGIVTSVEAIENYFAGAGYSNELQPPGVVVLLSDGARDHGTEIEDAIARAKAANVTIYTISFGSDGSELEPETMEMIARETGGEHFRAIDGIQLNAIYERLQGLIGYEVVLASVADRFAMVGGILLAFAVILVMIASRTPLPSLDEHPNPKEERWTMYAA